MNYKSCRYTEFINDVFMYAQDDPVVSLLSAYLNGH